MKNILKPISLILVLLMVLTFAACGEKTANKSSSAPSGDKAPSSGDTSEEIDYEIWDATVATSFAAGTGSESDPYMIKNGAELALAITEKKGGGSYYKLACDIHLNDTSDTYWMLQNNNVWRARDFKGTLDGDGHCIYGIWFENESRPEDAGLVTHLTGGGFKNLGIRESYVVAKLYAGAFAGRVTDGKSLFENCFADETVYVQYTDMGHNGAGGIMGYSCSGGTTEPTLEIKNCYSKANVRGLGQMARVNGIIGTSWNCAYTMSGCYSVGLPPYRGTNENTCSYLVKHGWKSGDVYKNNYTDIRGPIDMEDFTLITEEKMKTDMKLDSDAYENVDGTTPKLKVFAEVSGKPAAETADMDLLRYLIIDFSGGTGAENNPFIVTTEEQLRYIVAGYWENTYFKLGRDLYINDTTKSQWTGGAKLWSQSSSNSFGGHFDGAGHTIYGLYLNNTPKAGNEDYGIGLFPKITPAASIKNVTIKDSYLSGAGNAGAIAGMVVTEMVSSDKTAVIENCTVDESVTLKGLISGGIVGYAEGKTDVKNCKSSAAVDATVTKGDLIGKK